MKIILKFSKEDEVETISNIRALLLSMNIMLQAQDKDPIKYEDVDCYEDVEFSL